jgi:integrase/recombinase XerD
MAKKEIVLQSTEYKLLLIGFADWLTLLNYSVFSIPNLRRTVYHFLQYLEQQHKVTISQLQAIDATNYIAQIQVLKNTSPGHINKQIQGLKLFSKYLRVTGKSNIGFALERLTEIRTNPDWLTIEEIQKLYDACSPPSGELAGAVLGIRDAAMLALYYGCGLRLNEGKHIQLQDIDFSKKLVHIKKGKRYKERIVPIAEKSFNAIEQYIKIARPQLINEANKNDYLFIGANTGKAMNNQSLYIRLRQLLKKAKIKKKIGVHSLRHSIATHLLQSGMKLERIQQFLGHSKLDSTQIYTHLVNEIK